MMTQTDFIDQEIKDLSRSLLAEQTDTIVHTATTASVTEEQLAAQESGSCRTEQSDVSSEMDTDNKRKTGPTVIENVVKRPASIPITVNDSVDASASFADDDEFVDAREHDSDEMEEGSCGSYAQTDANPLNAFKKTGIRRQPNVEAPPTPQVEVRSPVADRQAEEYNMNFQKRGVALIINHKKFDLEDTRHGTDKDCERLELTLRDLDFEIRTFNDLKYETLMQTLKNLGQEDHSKHDCLLIAVLTHGGQGTLHAKDVSYRTEKLWENFTADRCPTLAGKPKIFVLQACKGIRVDPGVIIADRMADTVDGPGSRAQTFYTIPSIADIIFATATADGHYAWRNPTDGSWYIKILCEELKKHAQTRDLNTILTFVARRVAIEYESTVPDSPKMDKKKQIPCVISMLTRLVYLKPKSTQNLLMAASRR